MTEEPPGQEPGIKDYLAFTIAIIIEWAGDHTREILIVLLLLLLFFVGYRLLEYHTLAAECAKNPRLLYSQTCTSGKDCLKACIKSGGGWTLP